MTGIRLWSAQISRYRVLMLMVRSVMVRTKAKFIDNVLAVGNTKGYVYPFEKIKGNFDKMNEGNKRGSNAIE